MKYGDSPTRPETLCFEKMSSWWPPFRTKICWPTALFIRSHKWKAHHGARPPKLLPRAVCPMLQSTGLTANQCHVGCFSHDDYIWLLWTITRSRSVKIATLRDVRILFHFLALLNQWLEFLRCLQGQGWYNQLTNCRWTQCRLRFLDLLDYVYAQVLPISQDCACCGHCNDIICCPFRYVCTISCLVTNKHCSWNSFHFSLLVCSFRSAYLESL